MWFFVPLLLLRLYFSLILAICYGKRAPGGLSRCPHAIFSPHLLGIAVDTMTPAWSHVLRSMFGLSKDMLSVRYCCSNKASLVAVRCYGTKSACYTGHLYPAVVCCWRRLCWIGNDYPFLVFLSIKMLCCHSLC